MGPASGRSEVPGALLVLGWVLSSHITPGAPVGRLSDARKGHRACGRRCGAPPDPLKFLLRLCPSLLHWVVRLFICCNHSPSTLLWLLTRTCPQVTEVAGSCSSWGSDQEHARVRDSCFPVLVRTMRRRNVQGGVLPGDKVAAILWDSAEPQSCSLLSLPLPASSTPCNTLHQELAEKVTCKTTLLQGHLLETCTRSRSF